MPSNSSSKQIRQKEFVKNWLLTDNSIRSNGYNLANYPVEDAPVHHAFTQNNVQFGDGTLNLKVNGYGGSGYIEGAEIATNDKFQYASVRTVQKSSSTPGIVEGNFFYGMYAFRWRFHVPYKTHSW